MTSEQNLVSGRYRLGTKIGSGAMGVVWQAHDERLHRTVAIKQLLLQPGLSAEQSEESRQRAMREGRIAARLSHPNAITVYDVAEHDGQPWLIMEYLPSRSLAAVLTERGSIGPVEAAGIGAQIAAALVAAHAAGIVHRDIKPANVLLGDDGTVKITDFGISRATGDITVTATGMLAGTPAYLAPEVAKGEPPTSASDVFSLGSTLYTAIEGHSPFGLSENTLALLYAVAAGKITPPKQAGPLTALLMQLLRPDPTERPSMTSARDSLAALAAGKPMPSAVLAHQLTDPYPKPPRPAGPPPMHTPPRGHPPATRLDVHPFSEPTPSGPGQAMRAEPARQGPPPRTGAPRTPAGGMRAPSGAMRSPAGGTRPPSQGARKASASRGAPPPKGRDTRAIVLTVLAIVAAILVGILVASLVVKNSGDSSRSPGGSPTTVTTVATSKPTASAPRATTTARQTTTTTPPPAEEPTPADYEQAVRDYYALLPGNPAEAWKRLGDKAQRESRGYESYSRFYGQLSAVEVLSTKADKGKVDTQLRFVRKDGSSSTESYRFELKERDGALIIENFQRGDG